MSSYKELGIRLASPPEQHSHVVMTGSITERNADDISQFLCDMVRAVSLKHWNWM
jgi:hypothetical protein